MTSERRTAIGRWLLVSLCLLIGLGTMFLSGSGLWAALLYGPIWLIKGLPWFLCTVVSFTALFFLLADRERGLPAAPFSSLNICADLFLAYLFAIFAATAVAGIVEGLENLPDIFNSIGAPRDAARLILFAVWFVLILSASLRVLYCEWRVKSPARSYFGVLMKYGVLQIVGYMVAYMLLSSLGTAGEYHYTHWMVGGERLPSILADGLFIAIWKSHPFSYIGAPFFLLLLLLSLRDIKHYTASLGSIFRRPLVPSN